jgi:hypothetical protein
MSHVAVSVDTLRSLNVFLHQQVVCSNTHPSGDWDHRLLRDCRGMGICTSLELPTKLHQHDDN